jgi:hypothetical protein
VPATEVVVEGLRRYLRAPGGAWYTLPDVFKVEGLLAQRLEVALEEHRIREAYRLSVGED